MCTSQDFVNWVCGPDLLPEYLMHALIFSRSRLRGLSTGSTHKTIYFSTVEQFKVLVPPFAIQELFCEKVRKLGSLLLADSAVGLHGLRDSLSASIFATRSS
jgi:type I restriction enzyme S subunit